MCEESIAAIQDLPRFLVDLSAYGQDLRVYWRITEESRDGERRYDKELAVYLVSNLAREI